MFTKSQVSLLTLATLLSVSSYADEQMKFIIDADTDFPADNCAIHVTWCGMPAAAEGVEVEPICSTTFNVELGVLEHLRIRGDNEFANVFLHTIEYACETGNNDVTWTVETFWDEFCSFVPPEQVTEVEEAGLPTAWINLKWDNENRTLHHLCEAAHSQPAPLAFK